MSKPLTLGAAVAALLIAGAVWAAPKVGDAVTVRVLSTKVMKAPRFVGPSSGTASRGEQLTVREVVGAWYRVEGRQSGWIHKTNVVEGKINLTSKPGGEGAASRDEVELAGRGFTPQVEDRYREQNPELDFSHVDGIERTEVDLLTLEAFVREGGLTAGGGR
jgi:hypothetical protein